MQAASSAQLALPVDHPSVWTAGDFADDDSWLCYLSDEQAGQLLALVAGGEPSEVMASSRAAMASLLPSFVPVVEQLKRDLRLRGFVLLRGVPVQDMSQEQAGMAFWAIGLLMGVGLTQNARSDLICPVTDMGVRFGYSEATTQHNARGYQSRADLNYHCDPTDVVALLCLRKAKSGGQSSIVSTPAIYNEMLRAHPRQLELLMRGFPYDRKGEESPGEAPVTERIPVFRRHASRVSCRYARSYIIGAALKLGVDLTSQEQEALDCFDALARREDMALKMSFEPGDIQLLNNFTVIHGRTSYEDHAEPELRRFLYRLWLHLGDEAPWSEECEAMRWAFARFGKLGLNVSQIEAGQMARVAASPDKLAAADAPSNQ
ncbi:TauD/TfdA family dioxygenase [Candidimonas nitroreducens]|uniref:TauD/TfdA-like domain-containing protein n=1 Tax=Candidimonas nitroreducens TaxID=683354 RepID=A0A225LYG6_9BURK|nr:TauD/TfdA family dioxygenase [Candidimonas nitroreducens]OWT54227.1 hypothetical protein CEY11_22960 [Candidimonas nitroreducens]